MNRSSTFTVHKEISLAKFQRLILLEKHHGFSLYGLAYQNRTACSKMTDFIGTVMSDKLSVKLNNVKFLVCYLMVRLMLQCSKKK